MLFGASFATLEEAWGVQSFGKEPERDNEKGDTAKQESVKVHTAKEELFSNVMDQRDFGARFKRYKKTKSRGIEDQRLRPSDPPEPAHFPVLEPFENEDEKHYINLAMYVFSGIVLIFVLEQCVQIGKLIRG